ncbi:MAG: transcriptional repressor [Thermodesulfovibrionia bacterium]|nr:transcriptional repressor [Nitrospirota bacterium]MDO8282006.1 transcriptional repressor [Thermodesulfovibrionia bacterium]
MDKEKLAEKKERLSEFIKTEGLKSTRQRDVITAEFLKTDGHVTAEELYRKIIKKHKNIGFTTVYRTLKLLAKSGLAAEQVFADNLTRYESLSGEEHHDHLICLTCGSITEFQDTRLENMQIKIADDLGFQILNHKMEFYGYCSNCRK